MAVLTAPQIDFGGTDEPLSQGGLVTSSNIMPGGPPPIYTRELLTSPPPGESGSDTTVGYPF